MNTIITNRNKIILLLFEEGDDDFLIATDSEQKEKIDALFLNRKTKGYFEARHLIRNETKFREFFR
jgi:hypothetical protein